MYNYQTFLREKSLIKKCEQIKKDYYLDQKKREQRQGLLVHSHKKRIEGFILSMIERPAQITVYKNPKYEPRPYDASKNISSNSIFISPHTQESRLEESFRKNKELDTIPFSNSYSHNFRGKSEGGKPLKYQSINHSFRIKEYLEKETLNYLPNMPQPQKIERLAKKMFNHPTKENIEIASKSINKNILPILHQKTYFNTVSTIYTEFPFPAKHTQKEGTNPYEEVYDDEAEVDNKKDQGKHNEQVHRKQNSKEALVKCGLLKLHHHADLRKSSSISQHIGLKKQNTIKLR